MAKKRKNYKKRSIWYWVLIYLVIGAIIYGLLYFSGIIGNSKTPDSPREIQYFE